MNELAKGERFMGVPARALTDDQDSSPTRPTTPASAFTLHVKDMTTGKLLPEKVERVASVAWAPDGRPSLLGHGHGQAAVQTFRHTHGTDTTKDALIWEEKDERFRCGVHRSRSRDYLLFPVSSLTSSEWRTCASNPTGELRLIAPREVEHEYWWTSAATFTS